MKLECCCEFGERVCNEKERCVEPLTTTKNVDEHEWPRDEKRKTKRNQKHYVGKCCNW